MVEAFDIPVKDLLKSSPHYFIREVFSYRVDGIHGQMIDFFLNNKFSLVLAPRGHGKSKILQGLITWMIVNDPDSRTILISDTDMKAQAFLRTIKSTIENSQILRDFYGDLKGERWTDHALTLTGRTEIHTEPSLLSLGAGSGSATGMHCDHLMVDDLVSFDSSRSELQRERTKDWYRTTLLPVLLSSGSISIAGTRYFYSDFYDMVINELEYPTLILPAINPDGSALCSWLAPLEDRIGKDGKIKEKGLLSIKKDLGRIIFALQYLNNVDLLKEGNIFRWEWMKFYDALTFEGGKVFVQRDTFKTEIKKVILGVDPAISQKTTADYTVVVAVGIGEDKKLYVLDVASGHFSYQQQKSTIRSMVDRWNPTQTIIESVAYQAALIDDLRSEGGLKIKDFKTTTDKVSRAMGISGWFENGNIYFRKDTMNDHVDSLLIFPDGQHDDFCDALGFAISGFKQASSEMVVINI